jgi:catechol 2,3-dioxygenase-like lactoylglutathione lyase family enzyme
VDKSLVGTEEADILRAMKTPMLLSGIQGKGWLQAIGIGSLLFLAQSPARAADASGEFSNPRIDLGWVVQDAAKTAQFLTNAIGFKEIQGFSVAPELGRKIGLIDGHAVDVRVFVLGDGETATRVKVLSFPKAQSQKPDLKYIHTTLGYRYLTLYVKDMKVALERLKKAQVRLEGETPLDLGGGTYIVVVRDPDGNFVELIGPMKP